MVERLPRIRIPRGQPGSETAESAGLFFCFFFWAKKSFNEQQDASVSGYANRLSPLAPIRE